MSNFILNVEQQKQVKEMVEPVFAAVEKLLNVISANGDHTTYENVQKATIDLNKQLFVFGGNKPTWNLYDIKKSLNKLIGSIPRISRSYVPYNELQEYLENIDKPIVQIAQKNGFWGKIKQMLGFDVPQR